MAASGRLDGDTDGRLACIALLLSSKANVELPDKVLIVMFPQCLAAGGNIAIHSTHSTCVDPCFMQIGRAPLHVAAQTGNLESLIRLLDAGAGRAPRDRVSTEAAPCCFAPSHAVYRSKHGHEGYVMMCFDHSWQCLWLPPYAHES